MKDFIKDLVTLSAYEEALTFCKGFDSLQAAWDACEVPQWMLWLLGRTARTLQDRRRIVLIACACARTALKYVPEGEVRPLAAIELAERWAKGEEGITQEMLYQARRAAHDAHAHAAAYADAADAAAAYAAAAADARKAALKGICALIREQAPTAPRTGQQLEAVVASA